MSGGDKAEFALKFVELMAAGKDDTWGPMLTDDAEFLRPFLPPGLPKKIKGRSEWVNSMRESFKVIKEFRWYDLELHNTDEPDVVYGTAKSSVELVDGRNYENEYVVIVKFEGDLIKQYWEYLDPLPVMEAFAKELAGGDWSSSDG
jgi:ketosteroid isomerase-like protein